MAGHVHNLQTDDDVKKFNRKGISKGPSTWKDFEFCEKKKAEIPQKTCVLPEMLYKWRSGSGDHSPFPKSRVVFRHDCNGKHGKWCCCWCEMFVKKLCLWKFRYGTTMGNSLELWGDAPWRLRTNSCQSTPVCVNYLKEALCVLPRRWCEKRNYEKAVDEIMRLPLKCQKTDFISSNEENKRSERSNTAPLSVSDISTQRAAPPPLLTKKRL